MHGHSFDQGALIRAWIPPMSTYTRVRCYLWNYHGDTLNRICFDRRAEHITLTWVKPTRYQKGFSLFYSPHYPQVTAFYDCTAGRCCLYRAMVRGDLQYFKLPCTVGQSRVCSTTLRCQWACHQFLLNALACSVFWSPPDVVHPQCRLASLH